jgi:hypothetical protein
VVGGSVVQVNLVGAREGGRRRSREIEREGDGEVIGFKIIIFENLKRAKWRGR